MERDSNSKVQNLKIATIFMIWFIFSSCDTDSQKFGSGSQSASNQIVTAWASYLTAWASYNQKK